jgi:hypothetical protein
LQVDWSGEIDGNLPTAHPVGDLGPTEDRNWCQQRLAEPDVS